MRTLALLAAVLAALPACSTDDRCDPSAPGALCTVATDVYQSYAITIAPTGEPWFTDWGTVKAITSDGTVETVIGTGQIGDSPAAGVDRVPAAEAELNLLTDLAFHDGHVYLAALFNSRVKRVRLSDMTLENVAGRGTREKYDGDGGPALDAAFDMAASLTIAPDGTLVIVDQGNQVVRAIAPDGTIDTIAGTCVAGYETCASADLVACPGSSKLACSLQACESRCAPALAGDGAPARDARFGQPVGPVTAPGGHVAFDRAGRLLVVDRDNHRVRVIDDYGNIVTRIDGLHRPYDVVADDRGNLYISDTDNHCIRKYDERHVLSTVAGECGVSGSTDELLDQPHGIALDGSLLYVVDTNNKRIRVANLAGR